VRVRRHAINAIIGACAAAALSVQCRPAVTDDPVVVSWSVSGLPPSYVERRWRAEVPAALRQEFDAVAGHAHFFDLPADLGGNGPNGRDMGSYSITIARGSHTRTVRFSDASQTTELSALRGWILEKLSPSATPD
jgi:hypothetical protein